MARSVIILLCSISLFISGCVEQKNQYIRDGIRYGVTEGNFSGRWWNFYERGRSFSDGRFYDMAIADFEQAVAQRGSDAWHARTYGMHFTDYFPHRELGVVYYQLGQTRQAIEELEKSISTAKSSKAHHFLNQARGKELRKSGLDHSAPVLNVTLSKSKSLTNSFTATVTGTADDDYYVSAVRVGDHAVPLELAVKTTTFMVEVALHEGENRIPVTATDLTGKKTTQFLNVVGDYRGPIIEVEDLVREGGKMRLKLHISDGGGLKKILINNAPVMLAGDGFDFNYETRLPIGKVEIKSADRAGNETKAYLDENDISPERSIQTASLSLRQSGQTIMSDASGPIYLANADVVDNIPPHIELTDWDENFSVIYDKLFLIEGVAADNSRVSTFSINNKPISIRGGKKVFFSALENLKVGQNEFHLAAYDDKGNKTEEKVEVERKVQKIRQIGSRMSIALAPFDKIGEPSVLADVIYDKLIDSFLKQSRFNLVERQKLKSVLQELQLSATDLVDPEKASSLGRIAAADAILAGTIIESEGSIEVISRLIDTETSIVLSSNDVFAEEKGLSALSSLLDSLAYKFKRDFPLLEGAVIEVKNKDVMVDIGKEKKIKPLSRLVCYREGPVVKHPLTGKILGSEAIDLAELKVKDVYEGFSTAEKVRESKKGMKVLDKVISK